VLEPRAAAPSCHIEDLLLAHLWHHLRLLRQGLVRPPMPAFISADFDNAEFVERPVEGPLAEQPRTLWDYGHSIDVLGRVIEVVSGQSLYQFEKTHLLDRSA